MILFDKVLPFPIEELDYSESSVWEKPEIVFNRGEFVMIRSASGKGKTTLLSIIHGIRKDYSGSVLLDNTDISTFSEWQRSQIRQKSLSYLFQGLRLFSDLTGFENIEINNNQTKFKSTKEIYEMAELLGVKVFLNKVVKKLSFGQRQRIALIRALCQPFEYLLLDEPFSHLDKENQKTGCKLIESECRKQGAGFILASLDDGYGFKYDKIFDI